MIVTEEQAKEKWCPFVRTVKFFPGSEHGVELMQANALGNRLAGNTDNLPPVICCIGSQCMAWRWFDSGDRIEYERREIPKPAGETNPPFSNCPPGFEVGSYSYGHYDVRKEISRESPRGYCGLAGPVER